MALDSANFPSELSINDPPGSDPVGQADDQIRTVKRALNQGFPNVAAAVSTSDVELNYVSGVTSSIQAQLNDGSNIIPVGTVMLFAQASAPTGWTKSTANNNKALRVVSGSGGGTGGSVAFTTAFTSARATTSNGSHSHTVTVNDHTLSTSEIPSHYHFTTRSQDGSVLLTANRYLADQANIGNDFSYTLKGHDNEADIGRTSLEGDGNGHNHTASSGATGAHTHTTNLDVQYVDVIVCSKDAY